MARRNLIHRKHLSLIRVYFRNTGWTLLEPKGPWEVFRANRLDHKRPIIVYRSFNSEHFTINDYDYRIFAKFLKWLKDNGVDTSCYQDATDGKEKTDEVDKVPGR